MKTILNQYLVILISILIFNSVILSQEWESINVGYRGVSVQFLNANTGYVGLKINSGNLYTIYKTTDKGVSFSSIWTTTVTIENSEQFAFQMLNESLGFLYIEGVLYKTTNGGTNWSFLHNLLHYEQSVLPTMKFYNENLGFVTFTSSPLSSDGFLQVWKFTNGGINGNTVFTSSATDHKVPVIEDIAISGTNSNNIILTGWLKDFPYLGYIRNYSIISSNGGATFIESQAGPYGTMFGDVSYLPNSVSSYIFLGSENYGLNNSANGTFCYDNVDLAQKHRITYSTDHIAGLSMVNENICFAFIGDTIFKSTNSGVNWSIFYSIGDVSSSNRHALIAVNENILYAVDQLGNFITHKIPTNLYSYFDNQSSTGSLMFDNISYNTPSLSYLRGGNSNFSSNNILNPGQGNERIFYKWNNNYMYPSLPNIYLDNSGNTFANYYKTKQLSTVSYAIANSSQTKSVRDTTLNNTTATHTIHESLGGIFYSKSTNYGTTYQTEETVNLSNISGASEGNKNANLSVLRFSGGSVPFTTIDVNRNVAVVWEKYNSSTGKIEIKLARRVLNTAQNGYEWKSYTDNNGNEYVTSFTASSNFESKPKCFAVGGPYDTLNAEQLVLVIPHLRPNGSQNKLEVSVRYDNQSQDYELDNGDISELSVAGPYNSYKTFQIHFTYKKGNNIVYRNETIGVDPFNGIYHIQNELNNNISSGDGYASRSKPDISLMNGVPVVSYAANYNANIFVEYEEGGTDIIPLHRYPIVKVQRVDADHWNNYVIYNSATVQDNPDIEGSTDTKSYLLNYSIGNGQFKKVVNVFQHSGYFCEPNTFTGTDSKLIKNSYSGLYGSNLSLLTLSPNAGLFKLDKQSFNITNINSADNIDNLEGVVNLDTVRYSFNLGPVLVKEEDGYIDPNFNPFTDTPRPLINPVEFNQNLKSNPFSLNETQALLLGCNVTYIKDDIDAVVNPVQYSVNLMNKTTGLLHRVLYEDTIHTDDSVATEFLRGYYITDIPNGEDSFYVQISVNNNDIAGGNYFINPGYNDGGTAGDNSVGYKTKIVFEKDNVQNKTNSIPKSYSLSQNYPNPFNPTTNLEFGISNLGFVTLKIYDLLGKEVATIINENLNPGTYKYKFDGSNLSSGIYFYRLTTEDFTAVKRMVLVK